MPNMETLAPGAKGTAQAVVDSSNVASTMGSGEIEVFATPAMIALMEAAAVAALKEHLEEGETSVGIRLEVSHTAATPVGMDVRAEAEVTEIDGRRIIFQVAAFDAKEKIGDGRHERFIVKTGKFMEKVRGKLG